MVNHMNPADNGYMYLQIEPYGFDLESYIIVQPYGHFYDFSTSRASNGITKVFTATWGRQFLIPAEYEVIVYFAPIGNSVESKFGAVKEGMLRLRAKY